MGSKTCFHFISLSNGNLNFCLYDKTLYSFFGIMDFYLENEDYFNNKTYCIYENFDY